MTHPMPRRTIQLAALAASLAAHAFVLSLFIQPAGAVTDFDASDLYRRAFAAYDTRSIVLN